jgi:hypothetical protein
MQEKANRWFRPVASIWLVAWIIGAFIGAASGRYDHLIALILSVVAVALWFLGLYAWRRLPVKPSQH